MLEKMNEYQVNCAVAEKLGLYVNKMNDKACVVSSQPPTEGGYTARYFNPCVNPNDYMSIAISNKIDVLFFHKNNLVYCKFNDKKSAFNETDVLKSEHVGLVVCHAFLLMDGLK